VVILFIYSSHSEDLYLANNTSYSVGVRTVNFMIINQ